MAGYNSGGVNFDDLFDPDINGDGPTAPALRRGAAPLRYAALSYGSKRADVGYRAGGSDVSNLWAARGTAQYDIPGLDGKALIASQQALTDEPTMGAQAAVTFNANGTWNVTASTNRGPSTIPLPTSGTWLPAGESAGESAGDYDVQYVATFTGGATPSNGAPAYAALSASRTVSLVIPSQPSNNANSVTGGATIQVRLRKRSSGSVRVANVTMNVNVRGYL